VVIIPEAVGMYAEMDLREVLSGRLSPASIRVLCAGLSGENSDVTNEALYSLIGDSDSRVGYNALWVFTHSLRHGNSWLCARRDDLIDKLLVTRHIGKTRMILSLLNRLPAGKDPLRIDYLDYCLSGINSVNPPGIRALCIRQAYSLCKSYPELLSELYEQLCIMDCGELSPGIKSARRDILKAISRSSYK